MVKSVPAFVLACAVCSMTFAVCPDGANLVANCGFELDTSSWSPLGSSSLQRTTTAAHSGVASGEVLADGSGTLQIRSACVAIAPSTTYAFGAYFRHALGALPGTCKVQIRQDTDGACSVSPIFAETPHLTITSSYWSLVDSTITTAGTTHSAFLDVSCIGGDPTTKVDIDDVFLGVGLVAPLFADGLESGDTSKWTATSP